VSFFSLIVLLGCALPATDGHATSLDASSSSAFLRQVGQTAHYRYVDTVTSPKKTKGYSPPPSSSAAMQISQQCHRTRSSKRQKADLVGKGYGSFQSAWRTLEGIETMSMIRKGRVRWVAKATLLRKHGSSLSSSLSLPNFSLTFTTELRFSSVGSKLRNETIHPDMWFA
jgi:hypothetical protein